jgi:hypothetical protein
MSIGTVLNIIKDSIIIIVIEIDSLNTIKKINKEKLPIYKNGLINLSKSINRLYTIFINDIPIEHVLKFSFINILKIKLDNFYDVLKNVKFVLSDKNCYSKLSVFLCNSPSRLLMKIEKHLTQRGLSQNKNKHIFYIYRLR